MVHCIEDAPLSEGAHPSLHPHGWRQPVSHRCLVDHFNATAPGSTVDLALRPCPGPWFRGYSVAEVGQGARGQPIVAEVLRLAWLHNVQFSAGVQCRPQRREMDVSDMRSGPEVHLR